MAAKRGAAEAGLDDDGDRGKVSKTSEVAAVGNGQNTSEPAPTPVVSIPTAAGEVFVQGLNDMGQLGLKKEMRRFPFPIADLEDMKIVAVEAGLMHTLCLTNDGKLYSVGQNDEGVLGRSGNEKEYGMVEQLSIPIARMSAGASHSACVDVHGNVYVWGCYRNTAGLFGKTGGENDKSKLLGFDYPTMQKGLKKVKDVASGLNHTAAITVTNQVLTWGTGEAGQLGRIGERVSSRGTHMEQNQLNPRPVALKLTREQKKKRVVPVQVSCGAYHTMCTMSDGTVYGWGLNNFGQVGLEVDTTEEDSVDLERLKNVFHSPVLITSMKDLFVEEVKCGEQHTIFRTDKGHVYACGRNSFNQLGLGPPKKGESLEDTIWKPTRILGALEKIKVAKLVCNYHINFAIDTDGVPYCWGMGSTKALAAPPPPNKEDDDPEADVDLPVKMHGGRLAGRRVIGMSCGAMHAITLLAPKAEE